MIARIKSAVGAVALAAGMAAAGTAYSATIDVVNSTDFVKRGVVECDFCQVLFAEAPPNSFSNVEGQLFDVGNSAQAEADWVNLVTGSSFTKDDAEVGKTELGGGDNGDDFTFITDALFILLKIGKSPETTLVLNEAGGPLTVRWIAESGQGAGLSHFTEFGVAPIPLPAAGLLLIGALGGLGLAARRRRQKA